MSKSTSRSLFGSTNRGQAVTVIEAPIRHNQRRKAIVGFWVALFVIAVPVGTVQSQDHHPIVGFLIGAFFGALVGAVLFALIVAWPVLRIIWHWFTEIGLALGLMYGWTGLMTATPMWLALTVIGLCVLPAAFPRPRYWMLAPLYCLAVRHRLRVCFAAFIATNRSGTLPLILLARPTPAGERVWVWLRPGLSIRDLEQEGQVQKLAVACWANEVRIARASRKYAALVRVDITRREPLANTVLSTLPDHVPDTMPDTAPVSPAVPPTGLNLGDVPAPRKRATNDNTESRPRRTRQPETTPDDVDPSDYA